MNLARIKSIEQKPGVAQALSKIGDFSFIPPRLATVGKVLLVDACVQCVHTNKANYFLAQRQQTAAKHSNLRNSCSTVMCMSSTSPS